MTFTYVKFIEMFEKDLRKFWKTGLKNVEILVKF